MSKEGVKIQRKRVEAIKNVPLPRSKKEIQSFIGKIYFLRIFFPNYADIVKEITDILRECVEVKWTIASKESLSRIKEVIHEALVLVSLDYTKSFQIFSFGSSSTIAVVLLQRNEEKKE